MFTANGERIALHHNDPHIDHQQDGGKQLLSTLLYPFLDKDAPYSTIREVLDAVADGRLTTDAAMRELDRIRHNQGVHVLARPVEVTTEGLQNACDRLDNALSDFSRAVDDACKKLDGALRRIS